MKVLVGSNNPVKIAAAKEAFSHYFENFTIEGASAPSSVSDQPLNAETYQGAENRAQALRQQQQADYYVGIEGGCIELYQRWFVFGVMCVMDATGKTGFGSSPHFELPENMVERILAREELGVLIDELTGQQNMKQQGGAAGVFTRGVIDRQAFYVSGLVMALVPFINGEENSK